MKKQIRDEYCEDAKPGECLVLCLCGQCPALGRTKPYNSFEVAKKMTEVFFPQAIALGGVLLRSKKPGQKLVNIERLGCKVKL